MAAPYRSREGLSTRPVGYGGNSDEIQLRIDPMHMDFDDEVSGLRKQVRRLRDKMFSLAKSVASKGRVVWAWLFLIVGAVSFMGFFYAAVISNKLQPPSHNVIIRAVQNDWYYCFLVPLTLPILVVAVYFHWLSMKLFKHA